MDSKNDIGDQLARNKLKSLIKKYNDSGQKDKLTLSLLFEALAHTQLLLAVKSTEGVKTPEGDKVDMQFITLTTGGRTFVTLFTDADEAKRLGKCELVKLLPQDYLPLIKDRHAVINPFSSYFLLWPELIRDHLIPAAQFISTDVEL